MASITEQKAERREDIYDLMDQHLKRNPQSAHAVAMALVLRMSSTMALRELDAWHERLVEVTQELGG